MERQQKNNRSKRIYVRFTEEEYKLLSEKFEKSTCKKLSEFVRNALLHKKISVFTRNKSLDDFIQEMLLLRRELNAIGNNFNQLVRRLNNSDSREQKVWYSFSVEIQQQLKDKTDEIQAHLNKFFDIWSQE